LTENKFVEIFTAVGPILAYDEFRRAAISAQINETTFDIYLSNSLIISKLGGGLYSLRGHELDFTALEEKRLEVQAQKAKERIELRDGWLTDGRLWVEQGVSVHLLRTGFASLPKNLVGMLMPKYKIISYDGEDLGLLQINSGAQVWGLKKALSNKGADTDDRLLLIFNQAETSVELIVGDEIFLSDVRAGKISRTSTDEDFDIDDSLDADVQD